jgi:hypothetical protein
MRVRFVVEKVALEQVFDGILSISPNDTSSPMQSHRTTWQHLWIMRFIKLCTLLTVQHLVMILGKWSTWRTDRFYVSDLHTERPSTQIDINRRLYWYNWFSWRWARCCSKHVENWNKYIEKNCALYKIEQFLRDWNQLSLYYCQINCPCITVKSTVPVLLSNQLSVYYCQINCPYITVKSTVPVLLSNQLSLYYSQINCPCITVKSAVPVLLSNQLSLYYCQISCPCITVNWQLLIKEVRTLHIPIRYDFYSLSRTKWRRLQQIFALELINLTHFKTLHWCGGKLI